MMQQQMSFSGGSNDDVNFTKTHKLPPAPFYVCWFSNLLRCILRVMLFEQWIIRVTINGRGWELTIRVSD